MRGLRWRAPCCHASAWVTTAPVAVLLLTPQKRFQQKGFKLVGAKLIHPTEEMAREHYSDLAGKPFFAGLTKFFSSGPVFAMCWEGKNVIKSGRVLLGATNPADSAPGTIRGDFCVEVGRNVCHGSDGAGSAEVCGGLYRAAWHVAAAAARSWPCVHNAAYRVPYTPCIYSTS